MDYAHDKKLGWLWRALPPALLACFTLFIYWGTLHYEFVFDDYPTIIEYIHARKIDIGGLFFRVTRWVSRLLNQFTYVHWQDNPYAYRIFDIVLHVLIGIMIFFTVLKLLSHLKRNLFLKKHAYMCALITMGLFLLHPVQTQTVTYITQMRLEGLVAFFIFAVLLSFVYAVYAIKSWVKYTLYGFSLVLSAFATGTKEIVIALPLLVGLVDWFFIAEGDWNSLKRRLWYHGFLWIIVLSFLYVYGIARPDSIVRAATTPVHNNRGNIITPDRNQFITLWPFFISQFKILLHYIGIFFWPFGICFDYGYRLSRSFFDIDVILPLLALIFLLASLAFAVVKNRTNPFVFAWGWFLVTMVPRASLFPGTELICDYKTYVPSFGILFFIALSLVYALSYAEQLIKTSRFSKIKRMDYAVMGTLFFTILGISTHVRNGVWATEETFWSDVIDKQPHDARAWNNYAVALNLKGDVNGAIKGFETAIVCDDFYAEPHVNLATLYHARGIRDKAYTHYAHALEIGEGHPELFNNLGLYYFEDKEYGRAEYCLKQAIALRPYYSRSWKNLGDVYRQSNRPENALQCYEETMRCGYNHTDVLYAYGAVCQQLGKHDTILNVLLPIAQKGDFNAMYYVAGAYFATHHYDKASEFFGKIYHHDPQKTTQAYNYALALLNARQPDKALPLFAQCLQRQENPYAVLHYGRCLFEVGKIDEAKKYLSSVLQQPIADFVRRDVQAYMREVRLT